MKFPGRLAVAAAAALLLAGGLGPAEAGMWEATSPDFRQTFAYGSEQHRQWIARGNHLGIVMELTNDPYVDKMFPRQYDDFEFNFPQIALGPDGRTFFYHPRRHAAVPVAVKHAGLFGAMVSLLPSSSLLVEKRHGLLRLTLLVSDAGTMLGRD